MTRGRWLSPSQIKLIPPDHARSRQSIATKQLTRTATDYTESPNAFKNARAISYAQSHLGELDQRRVGFSDAERGLHQTRLEYRQIS